MLSAQAQNVIGLLRTIPRKPVSLRNLEKMRAFFETNALPLPDGAEMQPVSAGGVPAFWVKYGKADPARRLLYLHGGAFVSCSSRTHASLAAHLARAAGCTVLLIDYRLAPENPFPAGLEDAVTALRWMSANGPTGSSEASKVFVAGDSAGGSLTLATLLTTRGDGGRLPDAAVTLSAWTDLAGTGASMRTRAEADPMLWPQGAAPCAALYLGKAEATNPLASPLYADFRGLPPLLMHVGDAEILLDDTLRVAEKAKAAGVKVTMEIFPELFHVFHLYAGLIPEATEAVGRIGSFLESGRE